MLSILLKTNRWRNSFITGRLFKSRMKVYRFIAKYFCKSKMTDQFTITAITCLVNALFRSREIFFLKRTAEFGTPVAECSWIFLVLQHYLLCWPSGLALYPAPAGIQTHNLLIVSPSLLLTSCPSPWRGGRIFFSRVNFVCRLIQCPFHPCVTTVACKRPWSFFQKCRWQVTAKYSYTLDPVKLEWAYYAAVQA